MNHAVEAFLNDVWKEVASIYAKESKRINEFKDQSRLQAGVKKYLRVAWRKGKFTWAEGKIHIDDYKPLSRSDSSYKVKADTYITELTDELLTEEFFPALCERVDRLFRSEELGARFFDYKFEVVLEFEWEHSLLSLNQQFINEPKLSQLKQTLEQFIQTKVLSDPPVLPAENDFFFFASHLVNPDLMKQKVEEIDPLIRRLSDKLNTNQERKTYWIGRYTSAFKRWAQDRFLPQHFNQTGYYGNEWVLKEEAIHSSADAGEMDFFLYAAVQIGFTEPDTRLKYLELAVQLGSKRAADYLKIGSGKFASTYRGERVEARNNDVTQTIDIRILSEEEAAYGEALDYIIDLLRQGFPKGYNLKLKSSQKHVLPFKKLAKSKLHRFFANALSYPALYPKVAEYADTAMEEFEWYSDVEPSEKSAMPGTYAVLGLGLYSEDYFPLVCRYMGLVDTEHQMVQDGYPQAFIEAHGVKAGHMPVIVSILLAGIDEGTKVKNLTIDRPELAEALIEALKDKESYQCEMVVCRAFGSLKKLEGAARKADSPLKERLEQLLALC
ncbi:DUF6138 family protein [Paenibacillus apiarius]|uniref:DUF6138 family protein n=1 Tax=Paenibacillus apiarius TaxID=46240 RepID=A0ABT4DZD4_9BACL|nr:DUF6138 family protein [Paenibacillus apiarius]MCY9514779.1 DUF6138 family protein [Paenibacillus apiarius]MCY9521341.1 DUF6138 family protein [Paenibacillus apiarius]MCY9554057.1 DUF6138 family protein [Paenibacillus apiarius]MCY9560431.1 DUF6138 family protein [Paenibacillus apiarius]MCY9682232.1 DUF6138 family protein [Paenibacillus apiarius]